MKASHRQARRRIRIRQFAISNNILRDVGAGHEPGSRIYGSTEATAAAGASSCHWDYQLSVHSVNIDQTGAAGWQPPVEGR